MWLASTVSVQPPPHRTTGLLRLSLKRCTATGGEAGRGGGREGKHAASTTLKMVISVVKSHYAYMYSRWRVNA